MCNIPDRRRCRCCGSLLYSCEVCGIWFAPSRKDQRACGDACKMRRLRAKAMMTTKDGKKYHVLGEVKDKERVLVAVKFYDKSRKVWFHELRPKEDFE